MRNYVSSLLEGNTSVNRPWIRLVTGLREVDLRPEKSQMVDHIHGEMS